MSLRRMLGAVALAAVVAAWAGFAWASLGTNALPVRVRLLGLTETDAARCRVLVQTKFGGAMLPGPPGDASTSGVWVREPTVVVPVDAATKLSEISVSFGEFEHRISGDEFRRLAVRRDDVPEFSSATLWFAFPDAVRAERSCVPRFDEYVNWPGDGVVLATFAKLVLFPGLAILAIVVVTVRWLGPRFVAEPTANPIGSRFWDAVGIAFLLAMIAVLEWREPFYFSQEDVLIGELPAILFGCRSAWVGEFPEYAPHLFLGGPLASTGMAGLTYPPTYLAFAVARLLGNENLTADVLSILHIVAGYGATRVLAGRVGMGRMPAVLVALSFVLSGSVLVMGRCWLSFAANAVWLPVLLLFLLRWAEQPVGWRWVGGMGLCIGLYFHVGFAQNAALACGFVLAGAVYLVLAGFVPGRRLGSLAAAFLVGAGVAMPLLYQQATLLSTVSRDGHSFGDIVPLVPAFFLPYPFAKADLPMAWGGSGDPRAGHLAFFGGLFAVLAVLETAATLAFRPPASRTRVWLVLVGLAVLFGLGEFGLLWPLGAKLPVIGSCFRYPFRVLPEIALFSCLAGGLVLDRLLRSCHRPRLWEGIVATASLSVLVWHVANCTTAFHKLGFTPYPPLPAVLDPVVADTAKYRFFADSPWRSAEPTYPQTVPHSLPLAYGLVGFDATSPLHENATYAAAIARAKREPAAAMRAYGVRWVLEPYPPPRYDVHALRTREIVVGVRGELVPRGHAEAVAVGELPGASPLAFAGSRPHEPLPLRLGGSDLGTDVRGLAAGDTVTLNFLHYPKTKLYLDGEPIPATGDDWGRISVTLPRSGAHLAMQYEPGWWRGIALGAVLLGIGFGVARLGVE